MGERRIRTPDQRLRVFVSSTLGELAEERRAARAALEQLRLSPIMFELGARPHPPRALYRSYLEQSDVFVGIYWQRYGWVAPDMEISGLEDEYVLSAGMPRLVYVKRPAADIEPRLAELLTRLQDEDTTSYKPFVDAYELQSLLLDDLAIMLAERFDTVEESTDASAVRAGLPAPTSAFVGREAALSEVYRLIETDDVRLVTLTGPGGTGKTRLALQAATELIERYDGSVVFVDLSPARRPDDVFTAIVHAVGLRGAGEDPPLEALERGLRDTRMLLILDNFEQVTSAAPDVVSFLERCPHLKILVTSRENLRVRGETVFPVPPLSLPEIVGKISVDHVMESEAVRLFVDRARAQVPDFAVTEENATEIAAICAHLDGLPLAIELAAARANLFAVDELRVRLENRLDELKGGPRDLPERQQTLRRAIEWSTELLDADERTMLEVFSVFSGARLSDVEETTDRVPPLAGVDVIQTMGSLVDKNLIRSTVDASARPRFSMLETIRAYAAEHLESKPETAAAVRSAHAEHYTDLAREWRGRVALDDDVLVTLRSELDNLRSAWSYWVAESAVVPLNDLLELLWGYYDAQGNYRAAVELGNDLLEVLSLQPETPERIRDEIAVEMSLARSMIAVHGYTAEVERRIREAIERSDAAGDIQQRFPVLRSLATLHLLRADFQRGAEIGRELLAVAEAQQDPALLTDAHLIVGMNTMVDDVDSSLRHLDEAIEQSSQKQSGLVQFRVGPNPAVVSRMVSGLLLWMVGFPDRSESRVERALEIAGELGHPYSMAYALFHASLSALWREDLELVAERATELLHVARAHDYPIWRALGLVLQGTASIGLGAAEEGLSEVDQGFTLYQGLSTPPVFWGGLLTIRAAGSLMAGRPETALDYIQQAEAALWDGDPQEPELALMRGDLLLSIPTADTEAAEKFYEHAASLSCERGLRMTHLIAATRLAELRRGTSRADEATAELREVFDSFTEGFGTSQLRAAGEALSV